MSVLWTLSRPVAACNTSSMRTAQISSKSVEPSEDLQCDWPASLQPERGRMQLPGAPQRDFQHAPGRCWQRRKEDEGLRRRRPTGIQRRRADSIKHHPHSSTFPPFHPHSRRPRLPRLTRSSTAVPLRRPGSASAEFGTLGKILPGANGYPTSVDSTARLSVVACRPETYVCDIACILLHPVGDGHVKQCRLTPLSSVASPWITQGRSPLPAARAKSAARTARARWRCRATA